MVRKRRRWSEEGTLLDSLAGLAIHFEWLGPDNKDIFGSDFDSPFIAEFRDLPYSTETEEPRLPMLCYT